MEELNKLQEENFRNLEFIRLYLLNTKVSPDIINHPRFQSILWKISSIFRRSGNKAYTGEALDVLKSIIIIQKDGSLVILENKYGNSLLNSTKYYFDSTDMKLRRVLYENKDDGTSINSVSTYDEDGIEESLLLEQKCIDGSIHYSKSTRVPDRIDMIKVEAISEVNGEKKLLGSAYQIRSFCVAYEDIDPRADEIDPLDKVGFSFLGVPDIYRDLDQDELRIIDECDGDVFPLDDGSREDQFAQYVETNKFYGRDRSFEEAVARFLSIDDGYSVDK